MNANDGGTGKVDAADFLAAGGDLEAVLGAAVPMGTVAERHAGDVAAARAAIKACYVALNAPQTQREERKAAAKALSAAIPALAWLAVLAPAEWAADCNALSLESGFGEVVKNLRRAVGEAAALNEREVREEKRRRELSTRRDSQGDRTGDEPEPRVEKALLRKMKMVDGELVPGAPVPCLSNLEHIFSMDTRWATARYNRLTSLVEVGDRAQDGETDTEATIWCHRTYGLDAPVEKVVAAMRYVAIRRHAYDPLCDYLDGLTWDGVSRMSKVFADYFAVEVPEISPLPGETAPETQARAWGLLCDVTRCFFVGAVARAFDPGCKVDTMPVLSGTQGKGKSTTIEALVPDRRWFSDTHVDMSDKDRFQQLDGVWIYEMGEMDFVKGAALTRVKGYVTSRVDKYRKPYARAASENPRRTVFFGSTNDREFVDDTSGLRRFVPLQCRANGVMDPEGLGKVRDQVWAEAVYRWRAGLAWHLPQESVVALASHAEQFRTVNPWEQPILTFLFSDDSEMRAKRAELANGFHVNDVLAFLGVPMERRQDMRAVKTITGILQAQGCEKRRGGSHDGSRPRLWQFPAARK